MLQDLYDEIAALVDLGDDVVGLEVAVCGDDGTGPHLRLAALHGAIGHDVAAAILANTRNDNAASVR